MDVVLAAGDEVFNYLLGKGYIVRSGKALGYPESVRVTVGSREQNAGLIDELRSFLKASAKVNS